MRSPPHKAEDRLKSGAPKSPVLCREQTCGCQGEGEGRIGNLGLAEANDYTQDGQARRTYRTAQGTVFNTP